MSPRAPRVSCWGIKGRYGFALACVVNVTVGWVIGACDPITESQQAAFYVCVRALVCVCAHIQMHGQTHDVEVALVRTGSCR